eukprot:TRINITY_DN9420_c0_g1_i2.p1 TRINITY_DN9420_c0_g1~~TRINITY_DN9420_c0_g1_i2.p1  ORF type:complete len:720 (-),score=138.45 TRINITY_DN9420_c0_g1_i2:181-2340(-)
MAAIEMRLELDDERHHSNDKISPHSSAPPKSATVSISSPSPRNSTSVSPPKRPASIAHRSASDRPPTQKLERQKSESFTEDVMVIFNEFSKTLKSLQKPTVLLYGLTGTGKSSVLNAVFSTRLAETGEGKPVTQNFVKYAPDDFPIVIYDSRGLEHGRSELFLQETRDFLRSLEESTNPMENRIHVVWYVIDLANCRLQDFEGTICRTLFPDLPIIFLLNKCDLVSNNKANKIQSEIEKLGLKRCYGIFKTSADPDGNSIRFPDTCPVCGSDDLVAKRKTKMILCDKGHECPIRAEPEGFSEVVKATIRALPKLAQESFVCAQRVSVKQKDLLAKQIIIQHTNNVVTGIFNSNLSSEMIAMASRLGNLFGFVKFSSVLGQDRKTAIEAVYGSFFRRIQFAIMGAKATAAPKARLAAEGISLAQAFKDKFLIVMGSLLQEKDELPSRACHIEIEDFNVRKLYDRILTEGLDAVLDEVFSPTKNSTPEISNHLSKLMDVVLVAKQKKVFGAFLSQTLEDEKNNKSGVPRIIQQIIEYLETHAMHVVGLFRIPGNNAEIETLKERIEAGEHVDLSKCSEIHVVAGLLKEYFREIPEPVFTFSLYDEIIASQDTKDKSAKIKNLRDIVRRLPRTNRKLLSALVSLLEKVSKNSSQNGMTAASLGILFGPSLIRTATYENLEKMVKHFQATNSAIEILISNAGEILWVDKDDKEEAEEESDGDK